MFNKINATENECCYVLNMLIRKFFPHEPTSSRFTCLKKIGMEDFRIHWTKIRYEIKYMQIACRWLKNKLHLFLMFVCLQARQYKIFLK